MEIIIIIIEKYPVHVRSLPLSYCDGGSLPVSLEHLLHPSPSTCLQSCSPLGCMEKKETENGKRKAETEGGNGKRKTETENGNISAV